MSNLLVLASGSPRRKELLEQIGLEFEIFPAKGEEVHSDLKPSLLVQELAYQKAEEVCRHYMENRDLGFDTWVFLGSDTVVVRDDVILGKPKSEEDAFEMLSSLQGRGHFVCTGVAMIAVCRGEVVWSTKFTSETRVEMYKMSPNEIWEYIKTKEPMDKAGSYGIQGRCAAYIKGIVGDYFTVVGLPVGQVYLELKKHGFFRDK